MEIDLFELASKTKYPFEAFEFVRRGLDYTVRRAHGETPVDQHTDEVPESRHVSGRDLCLGLRDFALEQYGLMARSVLRHYRILSCEDFGHIVFAMVDAGLMRKTDDDTVEDFFGVYDFADAFSPVLQLNER